MISVTLKKLDAVRFPFEKPSIGVEKPSIQEGKPSIGTEKPSIRTVIANIGLTRPTTENILGLYGALGEGEVFGRSVVMKTLGLSNGPAGELIRVLLKHRMVDTVVGQGKGKYRFRDFTKEVQG